VVTKHEQKRLAVDGGSRVQHRVSESLEGPLHDELHVPTHLHDALCVRLCRRRQRVHHRRRQRVAEERPVVVVVVRVDDEHDLVDASLERLLHQYQHCAGNT
jgi:hypothetical protein